MDQRQRREERRRRATEWLEKYMKGVVCARCGSTENIDWHHDDHPLHPNARVSSLRTQGVSIARLQREIDRCEPLCRRCHMAVDGRMKALRESQPRQKGDVLVPPAPCACCKKLSKPLRKGLCSGCYNHQSGIRLRVNPGCDGCCNPNQ